MNDAPPLRYLADRAYRALGIADVRVHLNGRKTNPVLASLVEAVTGEHDRLKKEFAKRFQGRLPPSMMDEINRLLEPEINLDY